jgi:NADPH-dependent curcumin reductase
MSQSAKRVVLVSRPVGEPKASDFRLEDYTAPAPGQGQVLLRTIWLSLDPYMRGRMSDGPSYAAPVPIGGVMEGGTVSEVIASDNPGFAKGDIVLSRAGWQTHAVSDGKGLTKIDPKLGPVSTAVGVLGMPGMTAYTGLLDIGKPQPGETVVVAAASGAVGSAVGQIARIKGARAVGIAGGKDKCDYVKNSSASTIASIIAIPISRPSSGKPARKASTSISRMSAVRCSRRYSRCSMRSRAFPCAA